MNKYIVIFLVIVLQSCIIYKVKDNIIESFTYCWDENNPDLDTLLNFDGFYHKPYIKYKDTINKIVDRGATYYPSYIFYKNGFCTMNPPLIWISIEEKNEMPKEGFVNGSVWGLYSISGDTIKAQYIPKPGGMSSKKIEIWFKIVNENTIQRLYFKYRDTITYEEVSKYQQNNIVDDLMQFVKLDTLPNPYDSWLIKEKWFWCNEEDYKAYMKEKNKK